MPNYLQLKSMSALALTINGEKVGIRVLAELH